MNRPRTIAGSALPFVLVVGLVVLLPAPAFATAAPAPVGAADEARAVALLRRAVQAAASLAYTGTQVVTAWPAGGGADTRLLEIRQQAGGARQVITRDPAGTGDSTASAAASSGGRATAALGALAAAYELHVSGTAQVAGRPAWVVVAARDERVTARLWLDAATGLMLREDVFDTDGRLHRMAAFIDLATPAPRPQAPGVRVAGATLTRPAAAPEAAPGWLELAPSARSGFCEGAECPDALPGGFRLLDLRRGSSASGPVLHLLYGDGISAISVFVQSGELDEDAMAGLTRRRSGGTDVWTGSGWPDRQTWQGGSLVYTVVSDAAPHTLGAALAPLPHGSEQPEGGAFASLRNGLRSVLGWLPGD